jgi:metal-responsive CopG/Arc/MetJ family transcriptional regulator
MDFKINLDFKNEKPDSTLTITLPKELLEKVKTFSKKINTPTSRWVRDLLTQFVANANNQGNHTKK